MAKILFFTAGIVPTPEENAAVDALNTAQNTIGVRAGGQDYNYGSGIEPCDFVAGTVPEAYSALPVYAGAFPATIDGWDWTVVNRDLVQVYGAAGVFLPAEGVIADFDGVPYMTQVQLPGIAALAVNGAGNNTGITVTGTVGAGKTATFTVANGVITAIALT